MVYSFKAFSIHRLMRGQSCGSDFCERNTTWFNDITLQMKSQGRDARQKNNTSEKGHVISHFKAPTPTILTENDFHLFKYQILHPISICYNKNTRVFFLCIFQLSYCESNTSWLNDITLQSKSHLTPSDTHFLRLKK